MNHQLAWALLSKQALLIGFDDLLLLSVDEPRERAGYHSFVDVENKKE